MSSWKSGCVEIGFKDFASICRVCFAKTNLRNLQEMEYLVDVLQSLTETEISTNDGLPQNICNKCIKKLDDISDFMDLSKYNDTILKEVYLTQINLKTNTVIWSSENDEDDGCRKIDSHNETLAESSATTDNSINTCLSIITCEPEIIDLEENETEMVHDESDGSSYREHDLEISRINKRIDFVDKTARRKEMNRKAAANYRKNYLRTKCVIEQTVSELESRNDYLKKLIVKLYEMKQFYLGNLRTRGHVFKVQQEDLVPFSHRSRVYKLIPQ